MTKRDFLSLLDCSPEELKAITRRGTELRGLTSQLNTLAASFAELNQYRPGFGPSSAVAAPSICLQLDRECVACLCWFKFQR